MSTGEVGATDARFRRALARIGPTPHARRAAQATTLNMTRTGCTQLVAYNVLEAYGVTGCQNYPDNACVFTGTRVRPLPGWPLRLRGPQSCAARADLALYIGGTKVNTARLEGEPQAQP